MLPGEGNDPIRTPVALPTGRNFHALGGEMVPSRLAWQLGSELAADALSSGETTPDGLFTLTEVDAFVTEVNQWATGAV